MPRAFSLSPEDKAAAFDAAPWPALILDGDDRIVAANHAAVGLFAADLPRPPKTAAALTPGGEAVVAAAEHARREAAPVRRGDIEFAWPDRPAAKAELAASPLDAGRVLITLHLPLPAAPEVSTDMLPAAAVLGRTLAHEVKNPLAGIRGAAQLLRHGAEPEDAALAQLIMDETDRIRRLVDQVEAFSDERAPRSDRVNLHRVLDRVRALTLSGAPGLTIRERYDPSLPHASGDEDQLVQLFLNLVKNAAEAAAMREDGGGVVTLVTAFRHGGRALSRDGAGWRSAPLEVRVEDNGPGVPASVRPRLFDPFVTAKPMGTGLGLTVSAKLVAAHEGVIDFQSEPGRTVFRVLLPVAPELKESS